MSILSSEQDLLHNELPVHISYPISSYKYASTQKWQNWVNYFINKVIFNVQCIAKKLVSILYENKCCYTTLCFFLRPFRINQLYIIINVNASYKEKYT